MGRDAASMVFVKGCRALVFCLRVSLEDIGCYQAALALQRNDQLAFYQHIYDVERLRCGGDKMPLPSLSRDVSARLSETAPASSLGSCERIFASSC